MEEHRGLNRGSYIWGRSVHNTRIERLWFDVTSGFGRKWKEFFTQLEESCDLDPDQPHHIWLLHHLFLAALNEDAQEWAEAWNAHMLHVRGEPPASPRELFMFGMVRDGPRGLDFADQDLLPEELPNYGIDWDTLADPVLMRHHQESHPATQADAVPLPSIGQPAQLSHVPCEPPACPLLPAHVLMLDAHLAAHFDLTSG
ncbi:hypothetical protein K466DRAFT_607923 [Polyporus arcularius HHB13444]|uniref:Integrase core domain-containing protein n=1 Tax=Polyporus arcularius HHB13444 TaxID=1314778 RepID=A0A5C3NKU2_9APHY|nr:hypothetical protein K466DRAFT_607923 [Polyporus arcularius HHB13444]